MDMKSLYLLVPLAPLAGAIVAGLFCRVIPRWLAHTATILGVAVAFISLSPMWCRQVRPSGQYPVQPAPDG